MCTHLTEYILNNTQEVLSVVIEAYVRTFGGALFPRAFLYLSLLYTVAVGPSVKAALSTLRETSPVCCISVYLAFSSIYGQLFWSVTLSTLGSMERSL